MGFFDNLIKKEAKKFISNVVGNTADGQIQPNVPRRERISEKIGVKGLKERLEAVISDEYGDYQLRGNVPASEFGAEYGSRNYSYGLYKEGYPKALIIVIENRNHYRKKEVRLSRDAAERQGIPCMCFFSHLPNRTEYISERLGKNILR